MRRILISAAVLVVVAAFVVVATGAASGPSSGGDPTYNVELDNAFGLVNGEQMKVAGVPAGKISKIDLPQPCINGKASDCHALVTVQVTQTVFGSFHHDASCQSRPQSLIGEYFIDCNPGNSGAVLKSGSTIPIRQTQSTIPGDLLQAVMRMPYRERLTLIINELGAAVAGNSQNLQAALDRAVPALTETDNLLNLLANDSQTLQNLTTTANTLVSALADNSVQVQRFITQANNVSTTTATQKANLAATFHNLPPFLEELRPALQKLGVAVTANEPALRTLNSSAGQIDRLLKNFPPFSKAGIPALQSLGQASVTGKQAVTAATPTVQHLNEFAQPTPELAQNLSIVLHDLDDRSRATERDRRSPGGAGYTGLEALLQYVFQQTLNLDYLGAYGHVQAVDLFVSPQCSALATPGTISNNLKLFPSTYRSCYSWLGPNQPGVNSPDPSSPGTCPPDPGGQPPYAPAGARPTQTGCTASAASRAAATTVSNKQSAGSAAAAGATGAGTGSILGSQSGSSPPTNQIGQVLGGLQTQSSSSAPAPSSSAPAPSSSAPAQSSSTPAQTTSTPAQTTSTPGTTTTPNQAQQLLNYLLSP
jgi:virulence factor Mce-like protein